MMKITVNQKKVILTISLLLISLNSFYIYDLKMNPFVLGGCVLILFITVLKKTYLRKDIFFFSFAILLLMSPSLINGVINSGQLHLSSLLGLLLGLVVLNVLERERYEIFILPVECVIYVHSLAFLVQVTLYLVFNYHLDVLVYVNGEEQRIGSAYLEGTGLIRAAGLYNEPGTYSAIIGSFILCRNCLNQNQNTLMILASTTPLLSFSLMGIVFTCLIATQIIVSTKKLNFFRKTIISILILGALISLGYFVVLDYVLLRIQSSDSSIGYKFKIITAIFNSTDQALLLGHGFNIKDRSISEGFAGLGVLILLFFEHGIIIGSTIFLLMISYMLNYKNEYIIRPSYALPILGIFLGKITYTNPLFLLWLLLIRKGNKEI